MNNDGILDIAVSDYGGGKANIDVLNGYGDRNFAMLKRYSTGWSSDPASIAVFDLNNDSRLDLAISYRNHDSIDIRLRDKSEPFATPAIFFYR